MDQTTFTVTNFGADGDWSSLKSSMRILNTKSQPLLLNQGANHEDLERPGIGSFADKPNPLCCNNLKHDHETNLGHYWNLNIFACAHFRKNKNTEKTLKMLERFEFVSIILVVFDPTSAFFSHWMSPWVKHPGHRPQLGFGTTIAVGANVRYHFFSPVDWNIGKHTWYLFKNKHTVCSGCSPTNMVLYLV